MHCNIKNVLDNQSIKDCVFLNSRLGRGFQVFLLVLASLGVAVTENEVNLVYNYLVLN